MYPLLHSVVYLNEQLQTGSWRKFDFLVGNAPADARKGEQMSRPSRIAAVVGGLAALALIAGVLTPTQCWAQVIGQAVIAPNYDRIPIGDIGGLEGGAFTARADDASAGWYNPAGLVKTKRSSVSGNATIYESFETQLGPDSTTVINSIPSFVGFKGTSDGGGFAWGFTVAAPIHLESGISTSVDGISFDVETFTDSGGNIQPVTFTADNVTASFDAASEMSTIAAGFGLAWELSESFRFGLGARVTRVTLDVVDSASFRQAAGSTGNFSNYLQNSETTLNASADLLTYEFGIQWELGESFILGVMVRTASQLLSSEATLSFSSIETFSRDLDGNSTIDTVQVVDTRIENDQQEFEFRLPQEIAIGFAFVGETWEWEIDARRHGAISAYSVFGGGGDIIVDSRNHISAAQGSAGAQAPLQFSAKEVTNLSLGVKFKSSDSFWLHFGAFQDNSPVGDTNSIFDEIDFMGFTLGGSLVGDNIASSLGIVQVTGESPTTRGVPGVEITSTAINLSTTYSF